MSFEADLKAHLQGASAVSSLVDDRIHPVVLPEAGALPAVVYTEIVNDPVSNLDGIDGSLREIMVQLDCWGKTHTEAIALRTAVRDRMNTAADTFTTDIPPGGGQSFEPDTKRYRAMLECTCWYRET